MPQSKKRKKATPSRKPPKSFIQLSKDYIKEYERVANQIMIMANIEVSEYHKFTKRLRHNIMRNKFTPFRVVAQKDNKVHKSYLKYFNSMLKYYEDTTFYGDPKYKVTFLDYVVYGMPFIHTLRVPDIVVNSATPDEMQVLLRMKEAIDQHLEEYIKEDYIFRMNYVMSVLMMSVSTPIYRYYTSEITAVLDYRRARLQNTVIVSSFESEIRFFKLDKENHKAYRLWKYDFYSEIMTPDPIEVLGAKILLEVDDTNTAVEMLEAQTPSERVILPVYVQAHVIHRMRERLDLLQNQYCNEVISISFSLIRSVSATTGQRLIRAYDMKGNNVGYFPFVIEDNAILLRSFLPLTSPITPEGSKLYKTLGIQLNDSKYIGLDRLSFYAKTDFNKLPQLKEALQEAEIWHLTEIVPSNLIERREDRLLQRFFEYPNAMQTSELV